VLIGAVAVLAAVVLVLPIVAATRLRRAAEYGGRRGGPLAIAVGE
jgi:hypothetical protein